MRENRITDARQDGCVIACREVGLGGMEQVFQTRRASVLVTWGRAHEATSRVDSLNL